MKKLLILSFLCVFLFGFKDSDTFHPINGIEDTNIKRVVVSAFNPSLIYVASGNSLYKSSDGAKIFIKTTVFKDETVRHVFFDMHLADVVYVATSRHLYVMKDSLKQLFTCPDDEVVFTAAKHKGVFYIGTNQGLYQAREGFLKWEKSKRIVDAEIYDIEPDSGKLYLATAKGVYSLKSDGRVERSFVMRQNEEDEQEGLAARVIRVDSFDRNRIWLGTNRGLYLSSNSGETWKKLFIEGVDSLFVNAITQAQENVIYVASSKGFFVVDNEKKASRQRI